MKDVEKVLKSLTLAEKANLCSGDLFWWTKQIKEKGIPEIMMCDGPHGLRKQARSKGNETIDESATAVCYPTASLTACSFDRDLLQRMGGAIGDEAKAEKVSIVLGCGLNIKRSPLCGRNFEYFSEDPFLAGEMGAGWIKGIRSRGIFGSIKHFACNNQERYRMRSNAVVDERTLREIYLTAFERVVKEHPGTVMCCYNSVNGEFGSENQHLLKDILRDEWGFDGVTMTDWGAVNDRIKGIKATMDLEMPSSFGERDALVKFAVEKGELSETELDNTVRRLLTLIFEAVENITDCGVDLEKNHKTACEIAENSMVLLKNEDKFLPLNAKEKILIVGEFAEEFRFQGAGSSMINAYKVEKLLEILKEEKIDFEYQRGYNLNKIEACDELIEKACESAKNYGKVVVLCGLTTLHESEGYDRKDLKLPIAHAKLLGKLQAVNSNIAVCLIGGAPVEMDFADNVKAILNCYLSGEAGSRAMFNILYGKTNPSGKLAETIAYKLEDIPSTKYYTGDVNTVEYREGIYVGYRYFDTANVASRFPFGFGLSYTQFEFSDIKITKDKVTLKVKNVGDMFGKEVVQVYVGKSDSKIFRAKKELKGFEKVSLNPDEEKAVEIKLDERSFSYFNVDENKFAIENGEYQIYVAKNVNDIIAFENVIVESQDILPIYSESTIEAYSNAKQALNLSREDFEGILGRQIEENGSTQFTMSSTMQELESSFWGKRISKFVVNTSVKSSNSENLAVIEMNRQGALEMPVKALPAMSGGMLNLTQCEGLVELCNGKFFKGVKKLLHFKRMTV